MDVDSFLVEFCKVLEISTDDVTLATQLSSLKNWDSMTVLSFMVLVDQQFGGQINPDDIETAKTVEDLYRLASAQETSVN